MSSPALEAFLARLYADEEFRRRFIASPVDIAREFGLSEEDNCAVAAIDRDGLILAGESYARKRAGSKQRPRQSASSQLRVTGASGPGIFAKFVHRLRGKDLC